MRFLALLIVLAGCDDPNMQAMGRAMQGYGYGMAASQPTNCTSRYIGYGQTQVSCY